MTKDSEESEGPDLGPGTIKTFKAISEVKRFLTTKYKNHGFEVLTGTGKGGCSFNS